MLYLPAKREVMAWLLDEKHRYELVGLFFLFMQILVIMGNYQSERYDVFFWFCNHTPLFLSIAFFLKNKDMIKGIVNVGFIAQFFWTLDFSLKLITGYHIFGVTAYVFEASSGPYVLIPIIIHVFASNLALLMTIDYRPSFKTLAYSMFYILFLFGSTLTYTEIDSNINCVHKLCGVGDSFHFEGYTNFWPLIVFFFLALPTHFLQIFISNIYMRSFRLTKEGV